DDMWVGYKQQKVLSSGTPGQIEARSDFEAVKTLKEKLLGNDPDNDFSVKLPTEQGGHVVIRPLDVPELLRAARSGYGDLGITVYDKSGQQVGTLNSAHRLEWLKAFDKWFRIRNGLAGGESVLTHFRS